MSSQLDILALEPFYGGARRSMLETLIRCSRHRWTVLKLPPRRIERRLTAAATWFSEQLSRHWAGRVDLLFTSEAMNVSAFLQQTKSLSKKPCVVYFHSNQLPREGSDGQDPLDLVNLNTASAATEIWFNSRYHLRTFMSRASALVARHPDLANQSPLAGVMQKVRMMVPPVDMDLLSDAKADESIRRVNQTLFVETRDADVGLLNAGLDILRQKGEPFQLVTIGPVDSLTPDLPRTTLNENDEQGHARALMECGVFVSVKPEATSDFQAVRALSAGCQSVLPRGGVYLEILPQSLHESSMYKVAPESLAERIVTAIVDCDIAWPQAEIRQVLKPFDAVTACRAMDERFNQLVDAHPRNPQETPGIGPAAESKAQSPF